MVEVVQQTYVKGNTFLAVGGSYSDIALGDKNKLVPMVECCYMRSAPKEQGDLCWPVKLEKESWVRSTRKRSYRTSGSYRSELRIPGN